jgi:hypothetical protein
MWFTGRTQLNRKSAITKAHGLAALKAVENKP